MILENQWQTKVIYPFLYSSFSQCVAITKIIDFNVLDKVSVLLVCVAVNGLTRAGGRRLDDWRSGCLDILLVGCAERERERERESCAGTTYRANRWHIHMLNALLRLNLRINPRSRCSRCRRGLVLGRRANISTITSTSVGRAHRTVTGNRAAVAMRFRLTPRRRARAAV
ncbi:hypothetical protein GQ44DRAFT_480610 [Phaeosphaeriaceae sp. PMI808]|nr:hypothetical protein GQ44DRAFT_480610 [Phaeosphaeriaceae sp. PMI808]